MTMRMQPRAGEEAISEETLQVERRSIPGMELFGARALARGSADREAALPGGRGAPVLAQHAARRRRRRRGGVRAAPALRALRLRGRW